MTSSLPANKTSSLDPKSCKRNLLEESDSDSDDGGTPLESGDFKVNQEYARRYEFNKKREERHKLEEKFKTSGKFRDGGHKDDKDDDSSSSDETEDEDGFLATEDLDAQISATLEAIRNKDPRLYDSKHKFIDMPNQDTAAKEQKDKPVFLRDYHRENLLRGVAGTSVDEEHAVPQTYSQEQDALKKSIMSEINAVEAGDGSDESDDDDDDGGFMAKKKSNHAKTQDNGVHPSRAAALKISELDVENADKDPETFLSNFLSSRAWIPEEGGKWKAFESDDGDDDADDHAEEFEQAYNLRFEHPEKSNQVLKSYARDFAAARSVRREDKSSRQRQREQERQRKDEEKRQRREERARLRKLKLEETEERLRKVKQAAGAVGKNLTEDEWIAFLDDAWDNDKWEGEMRRRFGDEYYALEDDDDAASASDDGNEQGDGEENNKKKKKKHPKKPKWEDDIDIKDLIPDFEDDATTPGAKLSENEGDGDGDGEDGEDGDDHADDAPAPKKRKTSEHKRIRLEGQKQARQQRSKLEALVDSKLELTNHHLLKPQPEVAFRYRETSPQSFGMTARDILLAPSDKSLNDFFGLKKLATFRDPEKKRRDKKRLGKKARLREWRRGTFGKDYERDGPTYGFERLLEDQDGAAVHDPPPPPAGSNDASGDAVGDAGGSKKKRKRSKAKKE
ncbi:uncharacterized protein UV8b_06496 [Ustilaginoidea virens]|uniref:Kri1-like C-terminal domain-containing protein n=1 Tax=Ustilaginoidea virens TaxID=1159556 RepID=A0A063C9H0_USTVR|nr:uncharacterized protein UV8b_06496 [Ustilaginoidea virens]QUC22255.1 hypothetical protein UV8b_06496 [Ustilaginoidea virens]GAO14096.1 hypothetical protein UVI_02038130 [Ustilaginoidea virens]